MFSLGFPEARAVPPPGWKWKDSSVVSTHFPSSVPPPNFFPAPKTAVLPVCKNLDIVDESERLLELNFEVSPEVKRLDDTEGRRLVVVIHAKKGDGTPVWSQAFYRSSGSNSLFGDVWFPFYGIVARQKQSSPEMGTTYLQKSLPFPKSWPKYDFISLIPNALYSPTDGKGGEFQERMQLRSFILASAHIGLQGGGKDYRAKFIEILRRNICPRKADEDIQKRIEESLRVPDPYDKYYEKDEKGKYIFPNHTIPEINDFIGENLTINFGRTPEERMSLRNLSTYQLGTNLFLPKKDLNLNLTKKKANLLAGLNKKKLSLEGGNRRKRTRKNLKRIKKKI
jgi:hypothetical protein